jgi:allantoinase
MTIFRSRRVALPSGFAEATVHVERGRIQRIGAYDDVEPGAPVEEIACALLPGVVDTHVHVNEPGRTEWEGFETATRAAAAGGITTIVDMPLNSIPPATSARGVATKAALTDGRVHVDVGLWGGAIPENTTGNNRGLAEILAEGARGFKCFLVPSGVDEFPFVRESDVEAALEQLRGTGVRLMVHAELSEPIDAVASEIAKLDPRSYATYLASRPPSAEDRAVELLYRLAKKSGVPIHVVHLSSASALETIARARDEGVDLTAETAPHYLHFSAEGIPDGATWYKCAPPIRDARNRERLWDALKQGLISMVVSDHSPCIPELKRTETGDFMSAWGGIGGVQFGFSAVWTEAEKRGASLLDVVKWMSAAPARHAGLEGKKGAIAVGCDADLVAFDDAATFTVERDRIQFKNKLTPYDGETLRGVVRSTWLRGERVFDGVEPSSARRGEWLKRA